VRSEIAKIKSLGGLLRKLSLGKIKYRRNKYTYTKNSLFSFQV
jgi:hypothetical protein